MFLPAVCAIRLAEHFPKLRVNCLSSFSICFLSYFFPSFDVVVDISFFTICLFGFFSVGWAVAPNFSASSCFDGVALALSKVTVVEG